MTGLPSINFVPKTLNPLASQLFSSTSLTLTTMPASIIPTQTMAQDDQDGSTAFTSPLSSRPSWDTNPPQSPNRIPLDSEHALSLMGTGFPPKIGPHPKPDADAVVPRRVILKIMPSLTVFERQPSPQAPGDDLVETTGSETASIHTTRPDEHTASPGTTTNSSSEAGVDADAPPRAETSVPSPDRTGGEEDDFVPSRTEVKRKVSGSETDNAAAKRATPTKTRSD
ncbi:hypothetical protein F5X68DRAFT_13391 [Plectosphaerella plurivora]|uniref:Uncharacterized protein n=1 Tax=Plectosphaerella plurivora TaxID=936078 RepID=A0A9P8VBM8_9PEZI|nr:hypothetical protein F5X68DRAFT_13391 [Plectosphaerella plurivora]